MGVKSRRRQRKRFQYKNTAKKRQRNRKKRLNPNIEIQPIKKNWDDKKSAVANVDEMGLVFNLCKIKPKKEELITPMDHYEEYSDDEDSQERPTPKKRKRKKKETPVVETLEKLATKKIPKQIVGGVRLPKDLVDFATLMLDKHGSDFKGMARDPMNYYQDSWKQIRTKIKTFVTNPRYFAPYLKERDKLKLPELPAEKELLKDA
ncbi:nucleolar protein 16 [Palaemon carinicauda]|uniref:nucleolar protein 16 n=1 Tax=Palaemon carinicauda TaxID=392227 RepID=UPI0035B5A51B